MNLFKIEKNKLFFKLFLLVLTLKQKFINCITNCLYMDILFTQLPPFNFANYYNH